MTTPARSLLGRGNNPILNSGHKSFGFPAIVDALKLIHADAVGYGTLEGWSLGKAGRGPATNPAVLGTHP